MIARTLAVLALAFTAFAAPQGSSQCNTGSIQCCDTTYDSGSSEADLIMKSLNIDSANVPGGKIAAACGGGGINIGGGSSCSQIPVCCEDNYFGLIGVGCTVIPVNV